MIELFPSCYGFLYKSKTPTKKTHNRTSSDLIDKIIQNRHRKEGWEGVEEEGRVFSSFSPLPVFFIAGWNYSKLIFYFLKTKYIST